MLEAALPESLAFYRENASKYAGVAYDSLSTTIKQASIPGLRFDVDIIRRLVALAPGSRGLDAGCGAGARDVDLLSKRGCDMTGVDLVAENIAVAVELHPELVGRLQVADLGKPLPFPNEAYDFVLCNAVIQHLPLETTMTVTLPELVRVLRPGGVLQLMFKNGEGPCEVTDGAYDGGVVRAFNLYNPVELLKVLKSLGCVLVEEGLAGELGGIMYFTDDKPMRHCFFYVTKN